MDCRFWGQTDRGLRRENNQDTFLINKSLGLFVVADGMGGHQGGEVASAMAVSSMEAAVKAAKNLDLPRDVLNRSYSEASSAIFERAANSSENLQGMGTTMVAALLRDKTIFVANVGDSRCYLFAKGNLFQMTEDHSLLYEQYRAGLITEAEKNSKTRKNVITRSVGYFREVECDIVEREVQGGESYLFCTDGLTNMVKDEVIERILIETPSAGIVPRLIEEAKANGGDDNVTVMLLQF